MKTRLLIIIPITIIIVLLIVITTSLPKTSVDMNDCQIIKYVEDPHIENGEGEYYWLGTGEYDKECLKFKIFPHE